MKKLSYAVAALALATSMAAVADTIPNHHTGVYIEGTAGTNLYALGVLSSDGRTSNVGVIGYALNAALGYNVTPWFGLEGGFTRAMAQTHNSNHEYQSINAPYASVRFTAPIGQRFSLLAKVGAMYANASIPHSDDSGSENHGVVLPYVGVGASYAVTSNVDITAQYQGAVYGVINAGALTAGLTYHF